MKQDHDVITNRLLLSLPQKVLARLEPHLTRVDLSYRQVLDHPDGPIQYLYFVNRGMISLVKIMQDGRTVEVGAVGPEGITDPQALFGMKTAITESIVQIPGRAFRIRRDVLADETAKDEAAHSMMLSYTRFAIEQIVQTAACNRLHTLEERCCRWLLTAQDCALSSTFPLTHQFLATMLGVQRAGVSIAARLLKKAGLVQYSRGIITIIDRAGLEEEACECYTALHCELDAMYGRQKIHQFQ